MVQKSSNKPGSGDRQYSPSDPTRREALAKLGLLSLAVLAAEIVTLSEANANETGGGKKDGGGKKSGGKESGGKESRGGGNSFRLDRSSRLDMDQNSCGQGTRRQTFECRQQLFPD